MMPTFSILTIETELRIDSLDSLGQHSSFVSTKDLLDQPSQNSFEDQDHVLKEVLGDSTPRTGGVLDKSFFGLRRDFAG